jgi:hypothetical protein
MLRVSSERLAIGLLLVATAALACFAPAQSDTWWQLRIGSDILHGRGIPLYDTYSFTAAGRFAFNHEWLADALFYAGYSLGGMPAVAVVCASAITAAWVLSWRLTQGSFELRFLLFAGCLATCASGWAMRPQVLTLTLFALTCTLLVANRRLAWLPLLFVVWTNVHGGVALGIVATVAATGATWLFRRRTPALMIAVCLGCGLATCVSPMGLRFWPEVLNSIERSRLNQLQEWQPPDFSGIYWPFWAMALALPLATIAWWRRLDERQARIVAIALAVLPLAARSMRNVSVFLLVAVPALTAVLTARRGPERARRPTGEHEAVNGAILVFASITVAVMVILAWRAPAPSLRWQPMSPAAIEAVAACPDPIYNTYADGGFLIWFVPQKKVFIDNRQDPYPADLLAASRMLEFDGRYESLFSRYGIRCAIVPPASQTAARLKTNPAWSGVYSDNHWSIFAER